jgi:hypothetical protein
MQTPAVLYNTAASFFSGGLIRVKKNLEINYIYTAVGDGHYGTGLFFSGVKKYRYAAGRNDAGKQSARITQTVFSAAGNADRH